MFRFCRCAPCTSCVECDANEGQERCRLGKRPLIITHIHMHIRVGTGVLNTRHGQRTREIVESRRCRRAYHPKLLIWHGPRVGLLAIDEKCSFCEAVCCGVACPSTSITSAVQSLRSRACSKCCALAMSRVAVVQQDALMVECGQFLRTGESVVSEVHLYEFVLREMHCTTHYNDRPRAHTYICLARASQAGWSRADFRAENCVAWDCVKHLVRNDGPDDAI